jgi:hypothetical protein
MSGIYKLECHCGAQLAIPCAPPHKCPHCFADLDIQWAAEHLDMLGQIHKDRPATEQPTTEAS